LHVVLTGADPPQEAKLAKMTILNVQLFIVVRLDNLSSTARLFVIKDLGLPLLKLLRLSSETTLCKTLLSPQRS
jgi:hypothetical protein